MLQDIRENIKAAVEQSRTDVIRSVLETCNVQIKDAEGIATLKEKVLNELCLEEGTFLHLASKLNNPDVVRTLLACGSNPSVLNKDGQSAVEIACSQSKIVQQIFVEELLRAAASSDCHRVQQLLLAGITVNSVDSEESCNTALHWGACFGNREIVACLLAQGADVNATNTCSVTPLHEAVSRNAPDIVEELLNGGADPNIKAFKGKFAGKTPALLALDFPAIEKLIHLKEESIMVNSGARSDSIPSPRADRTRSVSLEAYDRPCNNGYLSSTSVAQGNFEHRPLYSSRVSLDLTPRIDQMVESLVRTHIGTPVAPLVTQGPLHLLWPPPRSIIELSEADPFIPSEELYISVLQGSVCVHSILDVWDVNRHSLSALGYNVRIGDIQPVPGCESESQVECCVNPDLFSEQDAYQIHITSNKMHVSAASLAGLQYALRTLIQLLRLSVATAESEGRVPSLPLVLIQDYPTLRHRAVLLDVTPNGRVPALEYLLHLIELWASLKISHLHLYTRLLPSREWQLSYTKSEMVTIHRYCQDRFISLVPVLDVEPHVTRPIVDLMWPSFQEILASFPNTRYVHVGPRLSSLVISPEEEGRLETDTSANGDGDSAASEVSVVTTTSHSGSAGFVRELWHKLGLSSNVTMMICANGLHTGFHNIPPNVVLVEYGFQADYDFVQWTNDFHRQGNVTCVCPGTASWNSLAGCPEASVLNIYRAVKAATKQGSLGVVIAHWSGSYHLTPHPFGWPGFVVGAGLTWSATSHWDYLHTWLPALLDTHIFLDSACILGNVVLELGYAETLVLRLARGQEKSDPRDLPPQDGSILYKLLTDPDNVNLEKIPPDLFMRVAKHIKRCQVNLLSAKGRSSFSEMVVQELQLAADLLLTACRIGRSLVTVGTNPNSNMGLSVVNLGVSNLPPTFRTDIANKLLAHIEQYKGTWLQRHLPSGLQSSLVVLNSALRRFVPEDSRSDSDTSARS